MSGHEDGWVRQPLPHLCSLPCVCRGGPNWAASEGDRWTCPECGKWWRIKDAWWKAGLQRYWKPCRPGRAASR